MIVKMKKNTFLSSDALFCFLLCIGALVRMPCTVWAEQAVCAQVKIEIEQELTLERTAFDARMTISNGLEGLDLENVQVVVNITDINGQDASSMFFVDVFELTNISDVAGTGTVISKAVSEIHWLIIPSVGAGGDALEGQVYYVGATLQYHLKGEAEITEVIPDAIVVKPQPSLVLDYFYPQYVLGDDPFTQETEPAIPYTMGVRVFNNGFGSARSVAIASAQPAIQENDQGLFIDFTILDSYVDDEAASKSLNLHFGDIGPAGAKMGRWNAVCTLMGEFVSFDAEFSHSDELGGMLTSLIEDVRSHFLIHDVLVDLPGYDTVRDFLALDGAVIRVYGSDGMDEEVTDFLPGSGYVTVSGPPDPVNAEVDVDIAPTSGPVYIKISEPADNTLPVQAVVRSDGKRIAPENFWISKERDANKDWFTFLNIFDYNSSGGYVVSYGIPSGEGILEVSPAALDFANVIIGQSASSPVSIRNIGNGPLTLTDVSLAPGTASEFSLIFSTSLPTFLEAGAQLPGSITFTPAAAGARNGSLMIVTDSESVTVDLTAMGDTDTDGDGIGDLLDLCDNRHETNDDFDSASMVSILPFVSEETCIDATYDVDYYQFNGEKGFVMSAAITSEDEQLDTVMGIFDPCGNLIHLSDDFGENAMPVVNGIVLPISGDYFIAVSSVPDYSLIGAGNSTGPYTLDFNVGPNYGDLDADFDSDGMDAGIFSSSYGLLFDDPDFIDSCDYFDDGLVGSDDLAFFTGYYGIITPAPLLPADVDHDTDVDGIDVSNCCLAYGSSLGELAFNGSCDFNNDGVIDQTDLAILADNFVSEPCL